MMENNARVSIVSNGDRVSIPTVTGIISIVSGHAESTTLVTNSPSLDFTAATNSAYIGLL